MSGGFNLKTISSVETVPTLITPTCPTEVPLWKCHIKDNRYRIFSNMHDRCRNPNTRKWKNYGGRGIKVCERWSGKHKGFANFCKDMGRRPSPTHTLDRINSNGNYELSNCRWLIWEENRRRLKNVPYILPKFKRLAVLRYWGFYSCSSCKLLKPLDNFREHNLKCLSCLSLYYHAFYLKKRRLHL